MKRLIFIAFLISSTAQATNAPFLAWYAQDQNGKAMPGAKLYFYQAGGAVAKNVYTDETCGTAIGSSLTADGAGRFRRFYMGALNDCSSPLLYKVVFKTAGGSTVWTEDNIASQKTNLLGIVNATSASATSAITGTNTANGYAINAVASAVTATEHPLNVSGKVAAPESSAVHIVPQQATPTALAAGDLWFDSTTGRPRFYNGTAAMEVDYKNLTGTRRNISQIHSITSMETRATGTAYSTSAFTILANTLAVGDTIRIKASLAANVVTDGVGTVGIGFYQTVAANHETLNRVYAAAPNDCVSGDFWNIEFIGTVRAIGAGGTIDWMYSIMTTENSSNVTTLSIQENTSGINTTANETFSIDTVSVAGGFNITADLNSLVVDITS